jgi:DamX protein
MLIIMLLIIGFLYKSDMTNWWQAIYQQEVIEDVPTAIAVDDFIQQSVPFSTLEVIAAKSDSQVSEEEQPPKESPSENEQENQNNVAAIFGSLVVAPDESDIVADELEPLVAPETAIADTVKPDIVLSLPADNVWFTSQADDAVVIQLLAVTKQAIAEQFVVEQQLSDSAKIYQTRRNNKLWWVVTYGNYETLNAARDVTPTLPKAVLNNQPFYKKISKIKQEIALLDQ